MPTAHEISTFTRFSRDAITLRVKRKGLSGDIDPRDVLMLQPIDEKHERKMSLEEARTQESMENAELKRIQRQKLEGELVPLSEMLPMQSRLLEGISAIIKSSGLEEERKADIFDAIQRHVDQWPQE